MYVYVRCHLKLKVMENIAWKVLMIAAFMCVVLQRTTADVLPPLVTAGNYMTVNENTPKDSEIGRITAVDPGGGPVTITTGSTSVVYLRHNPPDTTWLLFLNTTLDRETTNSLTLSFTAEGQMKLPFSIQLIIQDVNDVAPIFLNLPYNIDVEENKSPGNVVYTNISTTDPDDGLGGLVQFSMKADMQEGDSRLEEIFTINQDNGAITLKGHLDYETNKFYHYKITAKDGGNLTSATDLFITVSDVQDTPPYFTRLPYIATIAENAPLDTIVNTNVTALDGDRGVPNSITYDIHSATPSECSNMFTMNTSTGAISVKSEIDRDKAPLTNFNGVCRLFIKATEIRDGNIQSGNSTAEESVTITILDLNDIIPHFSNDTYSATVTENSESGTPLIIPTQIEVSDADQDQNSIFYIEVVGEANAIFVAEPPYARSLALVQLKVLDGSQLDYEARPSISIQIRARENTTMGRSSLATVVVNIINLNDELPIFNQTNYSAVVPENSAAHQSVLTVQASDKDSGSFGRITYTLEGDSERFDVDATGVIRTRDAMLDRETKDKYLLTVAATDGGGQRAVVPLTITVSDVNDNDPYFTTSYSTSISENNRVPAFLLKLTASDKDQENTGSSSLTYYLKSCTPVRCSNFSLDEQSGQLNVVSVLDYEQMQHVFGKIEIIVEARDKGSPPRSGNTTVVITVEDLNDMDPSFTNTDFTGNIPENSPEGQLVTQLTAFDLDGSEPNNVTFFMLQSGGMDNFRVDSLSGMITVGSGANLDRELNAAYTLTVMVIDRGNPPRSSTATVTVTVSDINDDLPVFEEPRQDWQIYENATIGSLVCVMSASDRDSNPDLEYTLLLSESQATTDRDTEVNMTHIKDWFEVDPTNGHVIVKGELDRETAEVVFLKILVRDTRGVLNAPQNATASLTITLLDVNDNPPVIKGSNISQVSEALRVGTEVTSLSAMDKDKDQTVTFSIADLQSSFEITPDGRIVLRSPLDREANPSVKFTVVATDSGHPRLSSSMTITISVADANDNDPEIVNTVLTFQVPENASIGRAVGVITAKDNDTGSNAQITFDFSDNVNDFLINRTSGEIQVKGSLDRETTTIYTIVVVAIDNPITDVKRRSSKQITIEVTDINDNTPAFINFDPSRQTYEGTISETEQIGSRVINMAPSFISATDVDSGENARLTYDLTPLSVDGNYFRIENDTGSVSINSTILGKPGVYNYTVTVVDHGSPPLSAVANLSIKVVDENLNTPQFESQRLSISVPECAPIGYTINQFKAVDKDSDKETNGKVVYSLESNTNNPEDVTFFSLNRNNGELTTTKSFDKETQSSFRLKIIASDLGLPISRSSTVDFVVTIEDSNDNSPVFDNSTYVFDIYENQTFAAVGTVLAIDPDDNAQTCYRIVGSPDHFNVSANLNNEGVIHVLNPVDRENVQETELSLEVLAYDCTPAVRECGQDQVGGKDTSITVHINVLDVNDNPPHFTSSQYSRGFLTSAPFGHVIFELQELVTDPDLGPNRVHYFYPHGPLQMDQSLQDNAGLKVLSDPLILTKNGSVRTNVMFPGDAEGLFKWRVLANDSAGNSTALLKLYIVGEDNLIRITVFHSQEELRTLQSDIVGNISEKTGLEVIADDIKAYTDDSGKVDPSKSNLLIHAVDDDEKILDAGSLQEMIDRSRDLIQILNRRFQVMTIQTELGAKTSQSSDGAKIELILISLIIVLVIAFFITVLLMMINIRKFRRKLRAATVEVDVSCDGNQSMHGSTVSKNPLFGKDVTSKPHINEDNESVSSHSSLDNNMVYQKSRAMNEEQELRLYIGNEDFKTPGRPMAQQNLQMALEIHTKKSESSNVLQNGLHHMHPPLTPEDAALHSAHEDDSDVERTNL